jgi:predicted transcriptional regulator
MSEPALIFSQADVAQLLRVTPAAIGNYRSRYEDTPAPQYVGSDGRQFWSRDGMREWVAWQDALRARSRQARARSAAASSAVESLRREIIAS